jgi:DNA-binding CsgD family transcriptional regulator
MLFYLFRFSRNALLKKEKIQAKTIMISISAACVFGFCFLMIFPVFGIYKIPLLTPYFFAVYLFGVFHAMNRYRFLSFGIKDISNEVLSYIKDIIIIMKPDKTIMDSNSNLSLLLSQNSDYFRGRDIMDLIEHNESFSGALDELIEGKINSFSSRIVYKNQPENIVTDSSVLRIEDKFGDFAAILIVSMENRGVSQFRKHFKITEREMEIIYHTTSGLTNKDISEKLKITERTVETHLGNIYNKLGVNNKVELLRVTGEFSI